MITQIIVIALLGTFFGVCAFIAAEQSRIRLAEILGNITLGFTILLAIKVIQFALANL